MNDLSGLGINSDTQQIMLRNLIISGFALWLFWGTVAIVVYRLIRGQRRDEAQRAVRVVAPHIVISTRAPSGSSTTLS